jgi:hypothetical protein
MKNEIFDEVLKQKIERQNLLATEQEIDRVHQHVRQNFSATNNSWIKWAAATSAIALISTLVFWNIQQQNLNEKLLMAVNDLQKELGKTNQLVVQNQLQNKRHIQNIQKESQQQIAQLQTGLNRLETIKNSHFYAGNNVVDHTFVNGSKSLNFENKSGFRVAGLGNNMSNNDKIEIQNVPQKEIQIKGSTGSNELASNHIPQEDNQALVNTENENKPILKDSVFVAINDQSNIANKSIRNLSDTIEIEKALAPKSKPFVFLKSYKYRLGVNGEFARDERGVGIMGEILLNKGWSFALGIKKGMISSDHFDDDDDYYMHKSRDFRSQYASNYNSATDISNIDFQYALLQLPLYINYRFPLKNNLNFVGSLGTDIDLSVRQMVKYESKFNTEMPKTNSTESVRQGMILNNGILSLGVEAQFKKHFIAQVSPYLLATYKLSEYRDERFAAGLRFRLSYQF